MSDQTDVISRVTAALGRAQPLTVPPAPPPHDDVITRLVQSDIGLPELFAARAAENKMGVAVVNADDLQSRLIEFLREMGCRSVALPVSPFLEKLEIPRQLRNAGF